LNPTNSFGINNAIEGNSPVVAITYHSCEQSHSTPLFMNDAG
jgi:hypothetical protein